MYWCEKCRPSGRRKFVDQFLVDTWKTLKKTLKDTNVHPLFLKNKIERETVRVFVEQLPSPKWLSQEAPWRPPPATVFPVQKTMEAGTYNYFIFTPNFSWFETQRWTDLEAMAQLRVSSFSAET